MNEEQRVKFLAGLQEGRIESATPETHPFALADDIDLCGRCGDRLPPMEQRVFRVVAYIEDPSAETTTMFPLIISECETCSEIEGRFHNAEFVAAAA